MEDFRKNLLQQAGLTAEQLKVVQQAIDAELDEGPVETECEHVSMRAEVMCVIMRSHAQIASCEGIAVERVFDADKVVSDFEKIWGAIEKG